jgi:hypothetical protein
LNTIKAKESSAAMIEKVAGMAVQLGGKHLTAYGAARSGHDFTQRQLMALPDPARLPQNHLHCRAGIYQRESAVAKRFGFEGRDISQRSIFFRHDICFYCEVN